MHQMSCEQPPNLTRKNPLPVVHTKLQRETHPACCQTKQHRHDADHDHFLAFIHGRADSTAEHVPFRLRLLNAPTNPMISNTEKSTAPIEPLQVSPGRLTILYSSGLCFTFC